MHSATCAICGEVFKLKLTGRPRLFCSAACRVSSLRNSKSATQRFKNRFRVVVPERYKTAPKTSTKPGTFTGQKAGRGYGIEASNGVIELEVLGGRTWQQITSTDGVTSFITILQPSALREAAE